MKQPNITRLAVSLDIEGVVIDIGRLAWSLDDKQAAFEYSDTAFKKRLEISPVAMRLRPGVIMGRRTPFDGLHGAFADSLPDGWGRLLVDRQIARQGGNPTMTTPIDRLAIVGSRGMGALVYAPAIDIETPAIDSTIEWFAEQAEQILQGQSDEGLDRLLAASGGSAGARPKIMALRDRSTKRYEIDTGAPADASRYEPYIIKLKHHREGPESGRIEHAYAQMARAAGLDFPTTDLIEDRKGEAHFAVQRFDRTRKGRLHAHTLAGLLNADFRIPSLDYTDLLKVTKLLTQKQEQVEEAFARMIFNVLANNRDDHAKNHAFLMNSRGLWRLSPAYDLTLSDGPGGEHNMTVAGQGRTPTFEDFMKVADAGNIPAPVAKTIVDRVADAVSRWNTAAKGSGIGAAEASACAKIIDANLKYALARKTTTSRSARSRAAKGTGRGIGD